MSSIQKYYQKTLTIAKENKVATGVVVLLLIVWIVSRLFSAKNKIVNKAAGFLGEEETKSNQGFKNPDFEKKMREIGWRPESEWCAFFARMVFLNVLTGKRREIADKLISGSTQTTYRNFENDTSGLFKVSQTPTKGSIIIWQSTSNSAKGHAGIVTGTFAGGFETIEGNTYAETYNEGKVVRKKYEFSKPSKTLKIRGFISIA